MSSRPLIKPFQVITNGSMSSSIISDVTIIDNISVISYDISWSGTSPVGTMSVQVSNTYRENANSTAVAVAGDWTSLPLSSTPSIASNSGNGAIDIDVTGFNAIRLVYNFISGTGTMNAWLSAKVT
jgi:hypothetical protein